MMARNKGFSLVELIVTVVLISIIASLLVPKILRITDRSEQQVVKDVVQGLNSAVAAYDSVLTPLSELVPANNAEVADELKVINEYLKYEPADENSMTDPKYAPGSGQPFVKPEWNPATGGANSTQMRVIWTGHNFALTQSTSDGPGLIIDLSGADMVP